MGDAGSLPTINVALQVKKKMFLALSTSIYLHVRPFHHYYDLVLIEYVKNYHSCTMYIYMYISLAFIPAFHMSYRVY